MFDDLLEANRSYVSRFALAGLAPEAAKRFAVVTCMDTRIEPLPMLGLVPGDAKIMRNAGGRVTDDVVRSLVLATNMLQVRNIAVMQHTRCALANQSNAKVQAALSEAGVAEPSAIDWLAMEDPDACLHSDVERLRSCEMLAPGTRIEGWRYDVDDGSIARLICS